MAGIDIRLNSQNYVLAPREDGSKISTRPTRQFVQKIQDSGQTRPDSVAGYETFIHPNLTHGFGRTRINSDAAFDPKEYRKFRDSTCDTRWAASIYLPILSESTTATNLDIARASVEFKGETNVLFESAGNVVNRQFTGASDTWENGGTVNDPVKNVTSDTNNTGAVEFNVTHTTVGANRCLVAVVMADTQFNTPTSIHYNGVSLTKAEELVGAGAGSLSVAVYYLVNPALGSNTFTVNAGKSGGGSYISSDAFSIFLINLTGIDQDSPLRNAETTITTGGSAASSITDDITTVAGDVVIGALVVSDGPTITAGAGQTEIVDIVYSSNNSMNISTETATTTTTTMSYSFGASEIARMVTAAFKHNRSGDEASVGLDMITHKNKLIAMTAEDQSQLVYTSSDGATWTSSTTQPTASLLLNDITSDENIDAGLLAEINNELIALLWHEDDGTITAFSSTNGGTTFADESNFDIGSANGPQGVAVYPDIDSKNKLYVGTAEGLYIVDTSVSDWTFELVFPMPYSTDNCRRMVVHQGSLWFAQGVDSDTPAPIYRLTVQGNSRRIESGYGLNAGDGVVDDMLGPIKWMRSAGDQLFISVGGGVSNRKARILAWNGRGWHHMTRDTTGGADRVINWFDVGSGDDGVPRLHYGLKTSASASSFNFLEQPLVNPRSGVTIKREDDSVGVTGFIDLPYIDLGMPHETKNFLRTHVNAESLDASNENILIKYGIDGNVRTGNTLGTFTDSTTAITFASNAGVSAKNIGMQINLTRGSTNTNTPKLKDIIVEGMVVPGNGNLTYQHEMIIDIDQTAMALDVGTETIYDNLKTLLATVTLVDFEFGGESRKVAVDREASGFLTYLDGDAYSSAPNSLAARRGVLRLVLAERIPLS